MSFFVPFFGFFLVFCYAFTFPIQVAHGYHGFCIAFVYGTFVQVYGSCIIFFKIGYKTIAIVAVSIVLCMYYQAPKKQKIDCENCFHLFFYLVQDRKSVG